MIAVLRSLSLAALLVLAVGGFAAEPAPAEIRKLTDKGTVAESGGFDTAFVVGETVDGIEFVVDDPKSANRLTLKYGTYQVTYGDSGNVDFLRGKNIEDQGEWAKACEAYRKAAQSGKYSWVKETAAIRGAQCALRAKLPEDAISFTALLERDAPRSVWLDDALLVRGQAQVAKGDNAGAAKTFATLSTMSKEWGDTAAIFGARGQAGLLAAEKKYAEAAEVLAKLLTRLDSAQAGGSELGMLRLELAGNLERAGKGDEAVAILRDVAYRAVGAEAQAEAHVAWARILASKADTASQTAAFDQAAMAASIKGATPATLAEARKLGLAALDKLAKDPAVSAADKAEYKRYQTLF